MQGSRKLFFCVLLLLSFAGSTGYASAALPTAGKVNETPWVLELPAMPSQWQAENTHARIVIFRLQRDHDNYALLPLNVFINKDYHASLYPEHQAVGASVCPGVVSLAVTPGNRKHGIVGPVQEATVVTPVLQAGKTYFYQIVMDDSGKAVGRWVDDAQAKAVLASVKVQAHTLSRVAGRQECPSASYMLNVSALFMFDKYSVDGLLPGAADNIHRLAKKINADYQSINKIVVVGHADPLGDWQRNQFVSEQRARTVMSQLMLAGIPASKLSVRGVGSATLAIADCNKYKKRGDVIGCNQPNRRVEVEVYGIRNVEQSKDEKAMDVAFGNSVTK